MAEARKALIVAAMHIEYRLGIQYDGENKACKVERKRHLLDIMAQCAGSLMINRADEGVVLLYRDFPDG